MSHGAATGVDALVGDALALEPEARAAMLQDACGGNVALRHEVESLLRMELVATTFLERPVLEDAAVALGIEADPPSLVGRQFGDYDLMEAIGAGGMGEVYRAHDRVLDRNVAIKLLPRSTFDLPSDRARALAEARAASRLNHPSIVTVHAVGAADDHDYIAMELVAGETLGARLRRTDGPLDVAEVLGWATQLADALAAAHREGVVHRDLKPENVMIGASGLLKVLDFGIAAREEGAADGPAAGTIGYMSPEQASGVPAKPVSDQFSFGVMLYEMLTGHLPFAGATAGTVLAAMRAGPPMPVQRVNRRVPAALARIVQRCLAWDPAERFATTDDLVSALRAAERHAQLSRRRVIGGLATAAVVGATAAAWSWWPSGRARLMAVLPFRVPADDTESALLSRGLAATLIERLSLIPSLTVLPRSLVANFMDDGRDERALARHLGADLVIGGTVRRDRDRVAVTAALTDVASGASLWSSHYDRPMAELLMVEEQIAGAIVRDGVHMELNAAQRARLQRSRATDVAAYELYLRAVDLCQQESEASYLDARDLLREALARDPLFAAGHAQMATTYAVMTVDGMERPTEAWPESSRHVRASLAADPDLPDAHASAAAQEFFFNWNWDAAEDNWRRAMRFGGAGLHTDLYTSRALQRWALGRLDDALALVRAVRAVDAVTPMYAIREADFLTHAGQLDRAEAVYRTVVDRHPADARALFGLADALRRQRRVDEAVTYRRRAHEAAGEAGIVEGARAADAGAEWQRIERRAAESALAALEARATVGLYVSPLDIAREHARLARHDEAAAWFDRAVADRAPGLTMLNVDTAWDGMRDDPRFAALRERVGLA